MEPERGPGPDIARLWVEVETGRLDEAATTAARLLVTARDRAERAEAEGAIAFMLMRMGRTAEAAARLRSAADLATEPAVKGIHLARAAQAVFLTGGMEASQLLAAQARVEGERGRDPTVVAEASAATAAVVHACGEPVRAARLAHRARTLAGTQGPAATSHSVTAMILSAALADADRIADAEKALGEAVQVCRLGGAEPALPLLLAFRAVVRLLGGDWPGAERDCRDLVSLGESTAHRIASPVGWGVGALVAASRGDLVSARQFLGEAGTHRLSPLGPYGEEWVLLGRAVTAGGYAEGQRHLVGAWYCSRQRPWFLLWRVLAPTLVRSSLRVGERALAEDVARCAAEGAELAGVAGAQACADQCAGLLDGDVELLAHAREGYAEARRPYWQAKTDVDLARAWMDRGDAPRAVQLLREATDIFHDLGATRTAAQAGVLLAHAAGSRPPQQREPHPLERLTRAERLVAVRAGDGKTNPQIADELAHAPRTVLAHLSNIYAKLAISSRVQLAAVLATHHPLGQALGQVADAAGD
jgi:DNA-binding CsgD family transcriptional regulator